MITILADHDLEGYVPLLWGTLSTEGWTELLALKLVTFSDVGLSSRSSDREVWRFAQTHRLILLTNNRNMKDEDSLEQTLRDENEQTHCPFSRSVIEGVLLKQTTGDAVRCKWLRS